MKWPITRVSTEEQWFERYVGIALSTSPPALPPKSQKVGDVWVNWIQCEPGIAFILPKGGNVADRSFARRFVAAQLAGHGFKQVEFSFDGSEDLRKTADWNDIMNKAKRLRDTGSVQIMRNGYTDVVGMVQGDHGTYQTEITRADPNSRSITGWQCECPWDQYAWQRTRQWKKYEGRPCAHVLALYWKSLSTPIDEEAAPQQQFPGMPALTPGAGPQAPGGTPAPPAPIQGQQLAIPGIDPTMAQGGPPSGPDMMPPFPMEGAPEGPVVSIPGAKPPSPLNPTQWPGTYSSTGWEVMAAPFNVQPEGFQNGNMVQILADDMGVAEGKSEAHGAGQYRPITRNSIGEVLGQDPTTGWVDVIFPLHDTGPMEPYHVRAYLAPEQLRLRPDVQRPGTFIKRQR